MKLTIFSDLINAAFPFIALKDDLDRTIARYFTLCFICTALAVLGYLATTSLTGRPETNWLGFTMILWFPVAYSMQSTFRELQDDVQARGPSWFGVKMAAGLLGTLAGIYAMMKTRELEHAQITQIVMLPLLSYGMSMWNTQVLIAMLNWRMFDKGGIVASILGIIGITIWYKIEKS